MHFIYILFSKTTNKFYVGETDNIEIRLSKHNQHSYEGSFTKIAADWKVVLLFPCVSREQAIRLEKFIKNMKSKVFIQKLIINPEILKDIISKNKF
ncbi:MAG: GIY-YIG nuclease family protein [Flavobacterium sp.]|jgi:putative endonuclease|nr:GIY-YIG nuclease family protein [Flavobacterium sp.]